MITDTVAINMIIDVNAAKSRIKSIILTSISIMFFFCSIFVPTSSGIPEYFLAARENTKYLDVLFLFFTLRPGLL